MDHLKTFESFNTNFNPTDPDEGFDRASAPRNYMVYVNSDEGENLDGDVRSESGKMIATLSQRLITRGVMDDASDLVGLRDYLIRNKKIRPQDTLAFGDTDHGTPADNGVQHNPSVDDGLGLSII